jgi:hypothetical protein
MNRHIFILLLAMTFFSVFGEAKSDGVTDSGLSYEVLVKGDGPKPSVGDKVALEFELSVKDGIKLQSNKGKSEKMLFNPSKAKRRLDKSMMEAISMLNVGSKYRFTIPPNLGFGNKKKGKIPPNATIIFEVELVEIVGKSQAYVANANAVKSGVAADSLSRALARDLIIRDTRYPEEETEGLLIYTVIMSLSGVSKNILKHAKKVNQTGVARAIISQTPEKTRSGSNVNKVELNVAFTEEGKKYVRGETRDNPRIFKSVVTYNVRFGEITGILFSGKNKTAATVEYTEQYTPTPFATFGSSMKSLKRSKKAYFQLYDDGWRKMKR